MHMLMYTRIPCMRYNCFFFNFLKYGGSIFIQLTFFAVITTINDTDGGVKQSAISKMTKICKFRVIRCVLYIHTRRRCLDVSRCSGTV